MSSFIFKLPVRGHSPAKARCTVARPLPMARASCDWLISCLANSVAKVMGSPFIVVFLLFQTGKNRAGVIRARGQLLRQAACQFVSQSCQIGGRHTLRVTLRQQLPFLAL